jgi:hypothetical protein
VGLPDGQRAHVHLPHFVSMKRSDGAERAAAQVREMAGRVGELACGEVDTRNEIGLATLLSSKSARCDIYEEWLGKGESNEDLQWFGPKQSPEDGIEAHKASFPMPEEGLPDVCTAGWLLGSVCRNPEELDGLCLEQARCQAPSRIHSPG